MTTSGTSNWNPDFSEIIEEAFERCGLEIRTGYDIKTARRSLNFIFQEWANKGINMWTIEEGTQVLTQGVATYTLPTDTVDLMEHVIRTEQGGQPQDITISRISVSVYATIPNKIQQGRPVQIYIQRLNTPQFTVWPVPDNAYTYTLKYWRLRRIQDTGNNGDLTADMPFRFVPAITAALAYQIALKRPEVVQDRVLLLKAMADEAYQLAADEDREKAPQRFVPRRSYISS
jgi:hypothetical protein